MTFALSGPILGTIDPNIIDAAGGFVVFKQVEKGDNPGASALLAPRPFSLVGLGTFNGDDTENAANSVFRLGTSGAVANGSSLITFPANHSRKLTIKTWARRVGATDTGYTEKQVLIVGAATPVVRQDTTGAIAAALGIPVAHEQVAAGAVYVLPIVTAEVGGVFVNLRNVAAAAIQTAVNVAAGIRFQCELLIDPLVPLPSP
jgi:hypothetical protein